ncbi:SDR family NAD(P)-dependent oxidoreductase [Actinomadura sp. 7K507]|uniref:SDR family NAD(P)-dependent oxidoreductase n=1 Tax=Actinomadura sp. 7K507 TaxID=2530365 RepID=UPI0010475917|nr:SDR family NAD(P)-dependent oxidoreductase [Actinomadura sp. 7K507]TDC83700.1 SDR family NAD(P)-dependent oxidoreductase [Actinomadura sp. 7K507]
MELNGKVAVVTGAGRGLGLAYAGELARAGAAVVVNDADPATAEAAAKQIVDSGGRAVAHAAAVGTSEAAESLVGRAVDEFGRLDVMVTNAGVLRDRVLWKMTDDDFDTVVRVHLKGTFTCARAAAVRFREQGEGGRLILVGSPAGQRGNFGQTNYSAAKAGIVGFARTWAMELARANVTVNAVVPVAATAMTETIPALAPYAETMRQGGEMPPFARRALAFGTPEDAAGLVAFLASDAASGVTGQAVGVGGDRLSLWTHPTQAVAAYRDGGWGADDIAAAWPTIFAEHEQGVGENLPEAPEPEPSR